MVAQGDKMKEDKAYNHNGWIIEGRGGCSMVRHYKATKNDMWHWAFKLYECRELCDKRDAGNDLTGIYGGLYLRPLYT